jgi:2',3'-cyclic-nucleotide 2'-phosphodiesterase/3'-nucleotidase
VILVVPAYGKVTVHSRTSNNWYRVTYNGRSGYIYGGYFTTDSGSSANTRIVKTAIYLRSSTAISSRANIIATIQAGEEVTIVSQANSKWYIVRYGSKTGYLRAGYFA